MKDVGNLDIREVAGGAVIAVKTVPKSSRDRIVGVLGDCLKVATSAPAEKGKANQAVAAILAKALGAGKRDVELMEGWASPRKEFRIAGMTAEQVRSKLAAGWKSRRNES
ncbi:MAG: hypothetical protein AMJ81_09575 [Phycisphaerae bacterium SM23_33]|jgi:uncharacterized protein (TIGR00251 family)|nr:MAG: hypothetical protein AMJ81_09575 [Phycisphaerae bacterium SM23_33]